MKQFNRIIIGVIIVWFMIAGITAMVIHNNNSGTDRKDYLVEVNRIEDRIVKQGFFKKINLSGYRYIKQVDYLPAEKSAQISDFFLGKAIAERKIVQVPKNCGFYITPYITNEKLHGYVRYAYIAGSSNRAAKLIVFIEVILSILFILVLGLLIYIRHFILKPFHEISELPGELSKGHLSKGLEESKNRYFGKFLWGLDQLRESLAEHKQKELALEKDKKLMILAISHDIKTPLSTIKLYSKALYDNLYDTEEKKTETAKKIEQKADQIEQFVKEIIKTSSSELFQYDFEVGEFYLSSLAKTMKNSYEEKLNLLKTRFTIGTFQDRIIKGNQDRLTDVFDNIIQNAIKYGDGREITVTFTQEDNCQLIRIFNTGLPVAVPNLHHMFESFWRGENAIGKQGNGLGLYICKQILHKMGGEIYAETSKEGMSFIIVLNKG